MVSVYREPGPAAATSRGTAKLELHALDDELAYETALAECQGVTAFHRWFFVDALAAGFGLQLRAFLVTRGDEPIGLVPLVLRPRGFVRYANTLPLPYVGPVARDGDLGSVLAAVEPVLRRERVVSTKWSFAPALRPDAAAVQALGFTTRIDRIFVARGALTPEQRWDAVSPKLRRAIRHLRELGAECGPSSTEEVLEMFPSLAEAAWERQGLPAPTSREVARAAAERLISRPEMRWRSVRRNGEFMALNAAIVYQGRLWGWKIVGPRVPGLSPHSLAYWDMIEQAGEQAMDFDLGGAPTEGILRLKERFACELEEAVVATRNWSVIRRLEAVRHRAASARMRLRTQA